MRARRLRVRVCQLANAEHRASRRQFAHVFHRWGVIRVASGFYQLPETHRLGLLLHEVGHVLEGSRTTEDGANRTAHRNSGVRIIYKDSRYGPELEWIEPADKARAREFLGI